MTMQLISVIVPTYKQARYLPICLDSIWFQEYPQLEIIVVNDGSPDDTAEVLAAYSAAITTDIVSYAANYNSMTDTVERCEHLRYPQAGRNLRIIHHPRNLGLSCALNTGLQAATGAYCTFIASDDILLPAMVTELYQALEKHSADFVYGDMHIVDDSGRILRRFSLPSYSFVDTFCHWYLAGICKLYKRSLHELHGWYDEEVIPQDHDMYLRFAMGGAKFHHVPKVLAQVRTHDRDRQIDNHQPDQWQQLYQQSARLVRKARAHADPAVLPKRAHRS